MRGSIRIILGLFILFGVAGGIDNATDTELLALMGTAIVGFGLMIWGIRAYNNPW